MLLPPDAALVRRDRELPGLELLFDTAALARRLQAVTGALRDLSPTYVRYKPGTSCLVAYRTEANAPPSLYAIARHRSAGSKLNKVQYTAETDGFGAALLADELIEIRSMRHDAELPALRRVLDPLTRRELLVERACHLPELHESGIRPLAYKPERRFVARLDGLHDHTAVLRLYTNTGFRAAEIANAALRSNGVLRIPRRIGQSNRHRTLLLEWLPGVSLRAALDQDDALATLERVGSALALLHAQSPRRLADAPAAAEASGRKEIAAVAAVHPQLVGRAATVAARIRKRLAASPATIRPVHGDFHVGQVVVMQSGIGFLDLDRAYRGDPAADLGNFMATLERDVIAGTVPGGGLASMREALLHGYGAGDPALPERVQVHTAAGLLRLATEPFRCRSADWPAQMDRIVARAGEVADPVRGTVAWHT